MGEVPGPVPDTWPRQPGSNLLAGNPVYGKGGPSANPGGKTNYQRDLETAIQKQETAARVCEVIEAMRVDAMAHEKFSPAAAKVYLSAVGLEMNKTPTKVDLSDAPPEVMQYLAGKIH